ncbi:fumarate hydratase [Candidatus Bathyarchaeota archaeon]|nr:fumarate hydratase [Candidatus Bathyarchaeota archaeon]
MIIGGKNLEIANVVENVAFNLIKQAVIYLPEDVKQALKKAYAEETSAAGKTQLKAILDNIELAEKYKAPICQDTGTIIFYANAGADVKHLDKIENALINATRKATKEVPLRPNAVDPFTQKNSGDNTGRFIPYINWDIVPGDTLELTVMTKGGGSENVCTTGMLVPGEGINGLKKFVIEAVIKAGSQPCPPTILGVAMGGGSDIAIKLAKKALLKPLNEPNPNPEIAKLEKELYEAANMTGIGPMGLGGKTTVLGVHVEYAFRHPASFPAAVAFNCWAARRATARIHADGTVEYVTHKGRV